MSKILFLFWELDGGYERTMQGQLCRFLLGPNALYGRQLLHQLKRPPRSEWPWLQTGHGAGFAPFASSCILNSLNGLQFLDGGGNLWSGIFWVGQLIFQPCSWEMRDPVQISDPLHLYQASRFTGIFISQVTHSGTLSPCTDGGNIVTTKPWIELSEWTPI